MIRTYIEIKNRPKYLQIDKISILLETNNPAKAKIEVQKMMRKRFGLELGKDYRITKTLRVKKR